MPISRKFKKTVILANLETVAGQAVATSAGDALLISDATFTTEYQNPDRKLIRPSLGHSGTLVGMRNAKIDFTVELSGSGTPGLAPAWGKLLQACAFAETITAGERVEYTPVSDGMKTLTIRYSADGVIHTAAGCMGTVAYNAPEGGIPTLKFTFYGADDGSVEAPTPASDLTAWKIPEVVNNFNSEMLTLGGDYAVGEVDGGETFCSQGLELDMKNDAKYLHLLGCAGADITDRAPAGKFTILVSSAQEVAMRKAINANTPTTLSLLHGSGPGKQVLIFVARAMRLNPSYSDYEGTLLLACDFNADPIVGNDEVRIVCL